MMTKLEMNVGNAFWVEQCSTFDAFTLLLLIELLFNSGLSNLMDGELFAIDK